MKAILKAVIFAASILAMAPALAGEQTVTLHVDGMTCASCPYIVKKTLTDVNGVTDVEVSLSDKTAVVTYDDNKTEVAALTDATTNMGFPSKLKE